MQNSLLPDHREAFQSDVLAIMLTLLQQTRFTFLRRSMNDGLLWQLLSPKPLDFESAFANPDLSPDELGIAFKDVENIELVETLMTMYDYGVLGLVDVSAPALDDSESGAAWTCRIVEDLLRSSFLNEWNESSSGACYPAVARCMKVCELACARLMLEGGQEGFLPAQSSIGHVTFQQLALLSGMTEASLRTIASRNSGLKTVKIEGNDHAKSTFIEIEHAKEWLKAKGRYAPLRRVSDQGASPMTERRFASGEEFQEAVDARIAYLRVELGESAMEARLQKTGVKWDQIKFGEERVDLLNREQLVDRAAMHRLGHALELPPELFSLRAAEATLAEQLRQVEQELNKINE